jgi:hypothetical protein
MDKAGLVEALFEAGLIQFGFFDNEQTGETEPLRLRFDLLPAYPAIHKAVSALITEKIASNIERILCDAVSLPLGVGVSIASDIPLVYSSGKEGNPVRNLVGAYDVGHPTVLVTNVYDEQNAARLIRNAGQVGLELQKVLCVTMSRATNEKVEVLLSIEEIVMHLKQVKKLPEGQASSVLHWLSTLRPDSGLP